MLGPICAQVREEQARLRPDPAATITGEVLNEMAYARQVVKEVLRYRPPAPMVPQVRCLTCVCRRFGCPLLHLLLCVTYAWLSITLLPQQQDVIDQSIQLSQARWFTDLCRLSQTLFDCAGLPKGFPPDR